MPTHFDGPYGDPDAIETNVHLPSAHMTAARTAGFAATEMCEAVIDDEWVGRKPNGSGIATGPSVSLGCGVPLKDGTVSRLEAQGRSGRLSADGG